MIPLGLAQRQAEHNGIVLPLKVGERVHGVLVAPGIRRVYAAATDARELVTLDEQTGAVVRRVPAGSYPDGIAYDPDDGTFLITGKLWPKLFEIKIVKRP